jgi:RNA polymerase sigma-70 factor (ECF subfamily)
MYRIALNTAISNFRKESRHKTVINSLFFSIPDIYEEGEEEKRTSLHLAIDRLTELEKAIIMLYLDEKSYEEISEIIGISNTNVGVRINRIKSKLSKLIKSRYEY